jgi:hypothetical protein
VTQTGRSAGILLLVALAGLAAWWVLRPERPKPEESESIEPAHGSTPPTAAEPAPVPGPPRDEAPAAKAPALDPNAAGRERIRRQNEVLQTVSDALDLGDAGKLRLMARTYREQNFEGANEIATGFEIIAECLDHPGSIAKAPAKYYDDNHRGSILQPYLRRACFPPE